MGFKNHLKKIGHNRLSKHVPTKVKKLARTKQGRTARHLLRHQTTSLVAGPVARYAAGQVAKQIKNPGSKVDAPTKGLIRKQIISSSGTPVNRYVAKQVTDQARAHGINVPSVSHTTKLAGL